MKRDCDECDWVDCTSLNSIHIEYIRGMPCERHAPQQYMSTFDSYPSGPCEGCGTNCLYDERTPGRLCFWCAELSSAQRYAVVLLPPAPTPRRFRLSYPAAMCVSLLVSLLIAAVLSLLVSLFV
jgi:hypothetical protein